MKEIVKSLFIVFAAMWLGSIIRHHVPLPIPDMIYAMIILFVLLMTGIVKLQDIDRFAAKLLSIFAFFFVPAGVGLMNSYVIIADEVFKVLGVLALSFLITILSVAYTIKLVRRLTRAK